MRREMLKIRVKQESKKDANYFVLLQTISFHNKPTNHTQMDKMFFS